MSWRGQFHISSGGLFLKTIKALANSLLQRDVLLLNATKRELENLYVKLYILFPHLNFLPNIQGNFLQTSYIPFRIKAAWVLVQVIAKNDFWCKLVTAAVTPHSKRNKVIENLADSQSDSMTTHHKCHKTMACLDGTLCVYGMCSCNDVSWNIQKYCT